MITIKAEQEHYCLLTDGEDWTVVKRRATKYHPLANCSGLGIPLDSQEAASLFQRRYPEPGRHMRHPCPATAPDISRRGRRRHTMRAYLLVTFLILAMMGAYFALLPITSSPDANAGLTGLGPG